MKSLFQIAWLLGGVTTTQVTNLTDLILLSIIAIALDVLEMMVER